MYLHLNIRFLRKGRGLSQEELGEKLGVGGVQVGKYEKGKSYPPLDKLLVMTEIFDVNIEDFILKDLEREEYRPANSLPGNAEEEDKMLKSLNNLLLKRVVEMEEEIKRLDPERARELGIK